MKPLLPILLLCALAVVPSWGAAPPPPPIIPQAEMDALNVYPTTDSAVSFAMLPEDEQESISMDALLALMEASAETNAPPESWVPVAAVGVYPAEDAVNLAPAVMEGTNTIVPWVNIQVQTTDALTNEWKTGFSVSVSAAAPKQFYRAKITAFNVTNDNLNAVDIR